jgi:hypothetical protein
MVWPAACRDSCSVTMKKLVMLLWPDWNALDSVKSWHTIFEMIGIALLALLIATEIIAFKFGQRKDVLIAEAGRASDTAARQRYDDAAAKQAVELDHLKQALSEASRKAASLDRLRTIRHLTTAQKRALTSFLGNQPTGKFTIQAAANVADARAYAEDIAGAFRAANWTVAVEDAALLESDSSGIWLAARGTIGTPAPPIAQTIYGALKSAEVPIRSGALRENNLPAGEDATLKIGAGDK